MASKVASIRRDTLSSGTEVLVATPSEGDAGRGVVVLTDIFGLRPVFEQISMTIAHQLDAAVYVLDPFPGVDGLESVPDRLKAVDQLTDANVLRDIDLAAVATMFEHVDVLGFCLGGTWAYKASASVRVSRAVSFYGPLAEVSAGSATRASLTSFLQAGGGDEVLAVVAGQDSLTPAESVRAVEDLGVTVVRFPEADHAFVHDPSHPNHRAADAKKAWTLAMRWLGATAT